MQRFFSATLLPLFVTVSVSLPAGAQTEVASATSESFRCELTTANGRALPDSSVPGRASDFYGNETVAIALGPEGRTITFRPGGTGLVLPDGSLQWKFLWAKARLPMSIEGRRLDAPAPPLRSRADRG